MACPNGARRFVFAGYDPCPGDPNVGVPCRQEQECQRALWKIVLLIVPYFLWTAWYNIGPRLCEACPSPDPAGKFSKAYIKMPPGWILALVPATGPGPLGLIPGGVLPGGTPSVPDPSPLPEYVELDKERCEKLLQNMRDALNHLRATGRNNEADTQDKAIKGVEEQCRKYIQH